MLAILELSGLDTKYFKAHSTRAASSKAAGINEPVDQILKAGM